MNLYRRITRVLVQAAFALTIVGLPVGTSAQATTSASVGRQALRRRVLLQSQVGIRGRIHHAIQEEPLSATAEAGGNGPNAKSVRGDTALSHHRRRTLGLPRHHRLQERRHG